MLMAMKKFPAWDVYQPPSDAELTALAAEHAGLRESEVSDRDSPLDNRTAIRIFLRQRGITGALYDRLVEPYDIGYYLRSDGKSTPIPSMRLRRDQAESGFCKDIIAVRHDLEYYRGVPGRAEADIRYREGQQALGASFLVASAEYLVLAAVGWVAWNEHAEQRRRIAGYGKDHYIFQLPKVDCSHT